MNKFEMIRKILEERAGNDRALLDVGCRGCELKEYVKDLVQYKGADLCQNPAGTVDFVVNVENGLPIRNESYDYVVALDLVEHLNDFQKGLDELLRVTKDALIILLPNMAHILHRKEFILHGSLGVKYDLVYGMGHDRHRWLTVLPQIDEYMRQYAKAKQLDLEIRWFTDGKNKKLFEKFGRLVGLSPSWWVWASLYVLTRQGKTQ